MLPLLTLALIAMGAAMPFFVSWMQDGRIGSFQEKFLLNTVNLTLRQDGEASTVLRLVSEAYATMPWDGRTSMTEQEACQAAMDTVAEMDLRGLLPEGDLDYLKHVGMWAEPILLLGEDGTSALVWECYWAGGEVSACYMMLDDVTGKAIHFLISTPMFSGEEDIYALYEGWVSFLTDYYDIEILSAGRVLREYGKKEPIYLFLLQADLKDGLEPCGLELELFDNIAAFNINTMSEGDTTVDVDAGSMLSR